jgi:hypothetical protein
VSGVVKGDGSKGHCNDDNGDDDDGVWKLFAEALSKSKLDDNTLRFLFPLVYSDIVVVVVGEYRVR